MKKNKTLTYIFFVLVCQLAGIIGSIFTTPAVKGWYANINRPSFSPPNWLFAPVWTTLFVMMGVSVSIIWLSEKNAQRTTALKIFFLQLILNTLWSIIFFGMENPMLAFFEIVILWFAILFTILKFRKINKLAAILLVPYILWVSFASVLNLAIALIN